MGMMTQLIENVAKEGIPGTVAKKYFHGNASPLKEFNTAEFARKGTGGMSQGWGHYITESESVGKHYAEITGAGKEKVSFLDEDVTELFRKNRMDTKELKYKIDNNDVEGVRDSASILSQKLQFNLEDTKEYLSQQHPDSPIARKYFDIIKQDESELEKVIMMQKYPEGINIRSSKFLHEISIPEDMQFIPWDEPLQKDMAMKIGRALKDYNEVLRERWPKYDVDFTSRYAGGNFTGGDMYREISKQFGGDKQASEFLSSIGIDGNKYKGDMGKGDYYNYVIFDDKKSKIIKSTMLASLMAALIGRDKVASPPKDNSY